MKKVVMFDLGNTLVRYFFKPDFPNVLREAIDESQDYLRQVGLLCTSADDLGPRVEAENHEAPDDRVRPLEGRLQRIFRLDLDPAGSEMADLCRCYLKPFFARAHCYDDTLPALDKLRARGVRTAIVSNLPWGSPAPPWHEEAARHQLSRRMDAIVFCTDVGWRKPARQIFEFTLEQLSVVPQDCVFVGDNPHWDVAGPRALGIDAVLIDRHGVVPNAGEEPIRSLGELWDRMPF
jgi:putative hydrolase of the HAD superfamily